MFKAHLGILAIGFLRSNIPEISRFVYESMDESYPHRASEIKDRAGHAIIGGRTYGQGSSREHAALAPRFLGLRVVIAKDFARIHWQNLIDFGVLPLTFEVAADYDRIDSGDVLKFSNLADQLRRSGRLTFQDLTKKKIITGLHELSVRQIDVLLAGGLINWVKSRVTEHAVHH